MDHWQLEALRDFAIDFLPTVQENRRSALRWGLSQRQYYYNLTVSAFFIESRATSSAIERLAARLLGQVVLALEGDAYEGINETLVRVASELSSATGRALPWLSAPAATEGQSAEPAPVVEVLNPSNPVLSLTKEYLSTEEAAQLLDLKPQTLHSWSSKQDGPIQPVKMSRRLYWRTADIKAYLEKARS